MSIFGFLKKDKVDSTSSASTAKDRLRASVKHSNHTAHRIKQRLAMLLPDLIGCDDLRFTHDKANSRLMVSIPVED